MDAVTIRVSLLESSRPAVTFFRLRPSDLFAPERPLLKRRQSGRGWDYALFEPVTGSAGLTAPIDIRAALYDFWRLHAALAAFRGKLRAARQPLTFNL